MSHFGCYVHGVERISRLIDRLINWLIDLLAGDVRCCRDRVTLAVLELIESGCLQTLKTKWWFDKGECSGKDGPPKKVGRSEECSLFFLCLQWWTNSNRDSICIAIEALTIILFWLPEDSIQMLVIGNRFEIVSFCDGSQIAAVMLTRTWDPRPRPRTWYPSPEATDP